MPAKPCRPEPIALPAGQQELLISPGAAFVVDGVQLAGPLGRQLPSAATVPVQHGRRGAPTTARWTSRRRRRRGCWWCPRASTRAGPLAPADGTALTPVTVNGWQQGWVVPAGTSGTVTLSFASNAVYRAGLVGGLALLPMLALLALVPAAPPAAARRPGAAVAARAGSRRAWRCWRSAR